MEYKALHQYLVHSKIWFLFKIGIINAKVESMFKTLESEICAQIDWLILVMEVMPDHVHLFLNCLSTDSPSGIVEFTGDPDDPATYHVEKRRFEVKIGNKDKTTIKYNDYITITGIQLRAYDYTVAGRSPIEWVMARYQKTIDEKSGIVNDPNAWLEEQGDPKYIAGLIERLVRVSVETLDIMEGLPEIKM